MIIRLTVNDNDFYYCIMNFAKTMWHFRRDNTLTVDEQIKAHFKHEDILQLINPNRNKALTDNEEKTVLSYIKENFAKYINGLSKDEDTKQYLTRNFEVKIQKTFTDKWENGEAVYWLQHSNTIINQ